MSDIVFIFLSSRRGEDVGAHRYVTETGVDAGELAEQAKLYLFLQKVLHILHAPRILQFAYFGGRGE